MVADLSMGAAATRQVAKRWQFFTEANATPAIVRATEEAEHLAMHEYFMVGDAGKGAELTTALVRAATRGVEVNLVADWASITAPPVGRAFASLVHKLEDAGGRAIRTTRTGLTPRAREFPAIQHVNHRKLAVLDSKVAFTGGMNFTKITDSYFDTMVRIEDPRAVADFAENALDRWARVGGTVSPLHAESVRAARSAADLVAPGANDLRLLMNAPDRQIYDLTAEYERIITGSGAGDRLRITSPGYSDQRAIGQIEAAAARGADTHIVTSSDAFMGIGLIKWVGQSHLNQLERAGGQGFERNGFIHRKALATQHEAIISSYNITGRSRQADHEIGIHSRDPEFVRAVNAVIDHDEANSARFDTDAWRGADAVIGDFIAQRLKVSY